MPHSSHLWPYDGAEMKFHPAQSGLANILLVNEWGGEGCSAHKYVNTHFNVRRWKHR